MLLTVLANLTKKIKDYEEEVTRLVILLIQSLLIYNHNEKCIIIDYNDFTYKLLNSIISQISLRYRI